MQQINTEDDSLDSQQEINSNHEIELNSSELNTPQLSIKIITFGVLHGKIPKHSYDLLYNLQELPNPLTAQARKKMTGLSKELREDFISNSMVKSHFETSYREIVGKLNEKLKELRNVAVELEETKEETNENNEGEENEDEEDEEEEIDEEEDEEEEDEINDGNTFVIAVCCHKGKHRSVSFAEILRERLSSDPNLRSSISSLNVVHRDVHKKGASNNNSRGSHKSKFFNDY